MKGIREHTQRKLFNNSPQLSSTLSPQKKNKRSLPKVGNKLIPLHFILRDNTPMPTKPVDIQFPEFWGCLIPEEYLSQNRSYLRQSNQQKRKSVDRGQLLYSRYIKSRPVKLLVKNSNRTKDLHTTRAGTTYSRSEAASSQQKRIHKKLVNLNEEIPQKKIEKYQQIEQKQKSLYNLQNRITNKGKIIQYLQKSMKNIHNTGNPITSQIFY